MGVFKGDIIPFTFIGITVIFQKNTSPIRARIFVIVFLSSFLSSFVTLCVQNPKLAICFSFF